MIYVIGIFTLIGLGFIVHDTLSQTSKKNDNDDDITGNFV